ncbi:GntR family transcriptional regulator [Pseudomonas sp. Marseille-QA0332]
MKKYVRQSTAAQAADALRDSIVFGDLEMGAPLSEATLAEQFGISRTPIREALRELAQEGLVQLQPYLGAAVFVLTESEMKNMLTFREMLETTALSQAIELNKASLIADLNSVVSRMRLAVENHDPRTYLALDTEFHDVIIAASENSYLIDAYSLISSQLSVLRTKIAKNPERLQNSLRSHVELLDTLQSGDSNSSLAVLIKHMSSAKKAFNDNASLVSAPVKIGKVKRIFKKESTQS